MDPNAVAAASSAITLQRVATYRGIRVLAWDRDVLYACRGYQLLRLRVEQENKQWEPVARFRPAWWKDLTSRYRLTYRLVRDGFHALTVLDDRLVGAVPGAIVTRTPGSGEFLVTHRIQRGTRPLHITATPTGKVYWGEYFDNRERAEVHIYVSEDRGATWQIAYTFAPGAIRHVHNIVHDPWRNCLWILTGDEGVECKILRASHDLSSVETVLEGNQQVRAAAAIPTREALYLSTDTPYEKNHVYRLDASGRLECVGDLNSSSIYGCQVREALFFSTMAEPTLVNERRKIQIAGSCDGREWNTLLTWKKDFWPMGYFQYGNVIFPDGNNTTCVLAATTIGVMDDDLTASLWVVNHLTC
jgi:hypothetical protein